MLDDASQSRFERERQRHFPASVNIVPAHVTLFHHLPGLERATIERSLAAACQLQAPAPFTATGLRFLGRGVAYSLDMPAIAALRQRLASGWHGWMTAQDRQGWRPHLTVQNKAPAAEAKRLHASMMAGFVPHDGRVTGLSLWRYMGGPWNSLGHFPFTGTSA